jgi:hypothetical protein
VGLDAERRGLDRFGVAVDLSADGDTAVVGCAGNDNGIGAAWIWTRNAGVWTQQGPRLVASDSEGNLAFQGSSVSLSADGDEAMIGGPVDHGGAGSAWIWTRNEGTWTQHGAKLAGSGALGFTPHQGTSVALSSDGSTAVVGAPGDDEFVGAVWVFAEAEAGLPNLAPYTPAGWSAPVVLSKLVGSQTDSSPIGPDDPLYLSWAVTNNGVATAEPFAVYLYLDGGLQLALWSGYVNDSWSPGTAGGLVDVAIGALPAGFHRIELVVDPNFQVAESNERDNRYSKVVYVTVSCPPTGPCIVPILKDPPAPIVGGRRH